MAVDVIASRVLYTCTKAACFYGEKNEKSIIYCGSCELP
jgi:hypothetical protein